MRFDRFKAELWENDLKMQGQWQHKHGGKNSALNLTENIESNIDLVRVTHPPSGGEAAMGSNIGP